MDVTDFTEIEEKFNEITQRIVWCTVSTMDRQGRPRSRILHPVWDGTTGWIATGRTSHKAKHIADNPFVSLCYWDPQHEQAIIDCKAEWADDPGEKQALWDLLVSTPEPVGYNPKLFWPGSDDDSFGALRLTPWRLEIWSLVAMSTGEPAKVWRQAV